MHKVSKIVSDVSDKLVLFLSGRYTHVWQLDWMVWIPDSKHLEIIFKCPSNHYSVI